MEIEMLQSLKVDNINYLKIKFKGLEHTKGVH